MLAPALLSKLFPGESGLGLGVGWNSGSELEF